MSNDDDDDDHDGTTLHTTGELLLPLLQIILFAPESDNLILQLGEFVQTDLHHIYVSSIVTVIGHFFPVDTQLSIRSKEEMGERGKLIN